VIDRIAFAAVLVACGSSHAPAPAPVPARTAPAGPSEAERERAHHDEVVASHRKIEEEQQDALGASCSEPAPHDKHPRCMPSCYPTEPADPRAGKKLAGPAVIEHVVCRREPGAYLLADELEAGKLAARPERGRFPPPPKKGSWQAEVAAWLDPKPARGDAIAVTGSWRDTTHPLTGEHLQCVTVSRYTRATHAVDACGIAAGCEADGNAAARGINVVHYRLAEARRLQAAGKLDDCQQAALEAIAVARGMPRWRQYAKLNVEHWTDHAAYRTRFDGTLDEDALFAAAASLGSEAETVYASCGGAAGAPTTPAQEQSFHDCW